jgi:thiol peroxidase
MQERSAAVTMHGNPLTLVGKELSIGDAAPDLELLDNDLNPVKLSSFQGKVCVISSVPSLDTPTCDIETRRFNEAAGQLGDDVVILTVSVDLPFAQKRWCAAAGVENVVTLSDHRDAAFGEAYGVLIKELRLLARSIFVIDRNGSIQYIENVKELSEQPNYDAVLAAAQKLV